MWLSVRLHIDARGFHRIVCQSQACLEQTSSRRYFLPVSTAEKIFQKAQILPEQAQDALLRVAEELAGKYPAQSVYAPLTLQETTELRGKLVAWEEDWNAPGMEAYDRT